jgi:hypothetical protein
LVYAQLTNEPLQFSKWTLAWTHHEYLHKSLICTKYSLQVSSLKHVNNMIFGIISKLLHAHKVCTSYKVIPKKKWSNIISSRYTWLEISAIWKKASWVLLLTLFHEWNCASDCSVLPLLKKISYIQCHHM